MKLPRKTLLEILDNPIEDTIIGHSRWSVHHQIIFPYEDKFYSATYSVGATEQQDESPWEYEKEVDCTEVKKVEKVIEVWEESKDALSI